MEEVSEVSDVEETFEVPEAMFTASSGAEEVSDAEASAVAVESDSSRMYASSETESEAEMMWASDTTGKISTDELGWASSTSGSSSHGAMYASSSDADDLMSLTKGM